MSILSLSDRPPASECKECGAAMSPTAKFCGECGATQPSQAVEFAARSITKKRASFVPEKNLANLVEQFTSQDPPSRLARSKSVLAGVVIAAAVLTVVAVVLLFLKPQLSETGSNSAPGSDGNGSPNQPQNAAGSSAAPNSSDDSASALIRKNSSFSECQVRGLEFLPYEATGADAVGYRTGNLSSGSDMASMRSLRLLYKTGYIHLQNLPIFENKAFWAPTDKANTALLGHDIQSDKVQVPASPRYPELGSYNGYKWTLILGCRQLQQVDATTPLLDGQKVDFSWHWIPTEFGTADGLTDERQRGVAYLVRENNGLAIDRIQFGSGVSVQ